MASVPNSGGAYLEIPADCYALRDHRAVIKDKDRDLTERVQLQELGSTLLAGCEVHVNARQIDALFGHEDSDAKRVGADALIELHRLLLRLVFRLKTKHS